MRDLFGVFFTNVRGCYYAVPFFLLTCVFRVSPRLGFRVIAYRRYTRRALALALVVSAWVLIASMVSLDPEILLLTGILALVFGCLVNSFGRG